MKMKESKLRSLQDLIDAAPDPVDYLYSDTLARHQQTEIRATVAPAPSSAKVRRLKRVAISH